ncbi:hypothetical protein M231_01561 [Tremella mesenterica]|uniref:COX assembly mitochondrial protein n=1 Tax=Tremella mesenterica TaxID=5217 RepID=A0A4V1M4Q2_TREME|nr:hypothetical protein M231_01561 [Tremella mesenterica]
MHPLLGVPERQLACAEYIQALEECHARGWIRYLGACNSQRRELVLCLRKERLNRTARNREEAKVRTAKKKEVWAELEREG